LHKEFLNISLLEDILNYKVIFNYDYIRLKFLFKYFNCNYLKPWWRHTHTHTHIYILYICNCIFRGL